METREPVLDWDLVERLLPPDWAAQARALGAFSRARKLVSPAALLRMILSYAAGGLSLQVTGLVAGAQGGQRLSAVAVLGRLRRAEGWLVWLVQALLAERVVRPVVAGYEPVASDGTVVAGPHGKVQTRVHYALSLADLRPREVVVSQAAEGLQVFRPRPGEVWIGDRGLGKAKGVSAAVAGGAEVIVRVGLRSMALWDERGKRLELVKFARGLRGYEAGSVAAKCRRTGGGWVTGRLVGLRLSPEAAEAARQRLRRKGQRQQYAPGAAAVEMAGYLCLFTTVPAERMDDETVLAWFRARWQVELAFKRLKTLLEAREMPDVEPLGARLWVLAKMVYALVLHAYLASAGAFSPWGYPLRRDRRGDGVPDGARGLAGDQAGAPGAAADVGGTDPLGAAPLVTGERRAGWGAAA